MDDKDCSATYGLIRSEETTLTSTRPLHSWRPAAAQVWDPSPLGSSLLRHLSITHQRQVPMIKPTPLHDWSDISAPRCQSVSWSYSCSCPALWQTHSYRAISLCRRFQKSQNRCRSSGTPRWPRSPSSNWSPSCPGASEPETEQKKKQNEQNWSWFLSDME